MSRYSMAQIVSLTGINSHTLRKWESRYDFLVPERTETNIRFYTDSQLKKLLNISILRSQGVRLSAIGKMSDEEIHKKVAESLINSSQEDEVKALVLSMINLDEQEFDNIIKSQIIKNGILTTFTEVIYPFLHKVGVLWGINKIMPAQEHFVSNLIRQKICSAIDLLPIAPDNAPKIILFLAEGENHEIGLLLASFIAKKLGWRVFYLGQNVPYDNVKTMAELVKPNYLLTFFITTTPSVVEEKLHRLSSETKTPLLFSGSPINLERENNDKMVTYLKSPKDLITVLEEVLSSTQD
ncbi:MerR family transcriptional regulator [Arenibacter sp. BSSL-BM3]|uniref:MerR family transcriptional regulator n=1 Tax=Arenibacter arenosicollis TaxID=2762274 RepID=A0ABR7QIZ5_9FLAO|nr:MerR family transcriptional regulator [Arenibacter arenosicollis]MBC8767157.1 MerR family transcriptional regulator [Arenibacter arenosicollis]